VSLISHDYGLLTERILNGIRKRLANPTLCERVHRALQLLFQLASSYLRILWKLFITYLWCVDPVTFSILRNEWNFYPRLLSKPKTLRAPFQRVAV
jgi:hypothetical protein